MVSPLDRIPTPRRATILAYAQVSVGLVFVLQGTQVLLTDGPLFRPMLGFVLLGGLVTVFGVLLYLNPTRLPNGQEPPNRRHYALAAAGTYGLLFAIAWTALTLT